MVLPSLFDSSIYSRSLVGPSRRLKGKKPSFFKAVKSFNRAVSEAKKTKKNVAELKGLFKRKKELSTKQILDLERKEILAKKKEELKAEKELAKIRKLEKELDLRKKVPFAP